MNLIFIFVTLIGSCFAAAYNPERVVGGSDTSIDQYPFMSNVQFYTNNALWEHKCGGSLINANSVLSCALCYSTTGSLPRLWRVRLGTSFASSGGTIHEVSHIIIHPEYSDFTLENDIAIIKLISPASFGETIAPARLPSAGSSLPDNEVVVAVGWGKIVYNGESPEILQHVETNIVAWPICAERYESLRNINAYRRYPPVAPTMICSGNLYGGYKDGCHQGDQGGPLLHSGDTVVGIISWAFGCGNPWYPGVNTKVSDYTEWIAIASA